MNNEVVQLEQNYDNCVKQCATLKIEIEVILNICCRLYYNKRSCKNAHKCKLLVFLAHLHQPNWKTSKRRSRVRCCYNFLTVAVHTIYAWCCSFLYLVVHSCTHSVVVPGCTQLYSLLLYIVPTYLLHLVAPSCTHLVVLHVITRGVVKTRIIVSFLSSLLTCISRTGRQANAVPVCGVVTIFLQWQFIPFMHAAVLFCTWLCAVVPT